MENLKLLNKETFTKKVLDFIQEKKIPAIEAIILCAEQLGIEIETTSKLIDKSLKEKVEAEASKLNLLRKSESLPI